MKQFEAFLHDMSFSQEEISLAIPKFSGYRENILKWNNKVNITSITNPDDFIQKHYVDSLLCIDSKEFVQSNRIIDVGTGGGFPGIPLAILFPQKQFVLLDSLQKRLKIVNEVAKELGITNIQVVHGRAEDLGREAMYREQFDLCVSRAVANLSTLSELCLPFVKVGGTFVAYKGGDCNAEVANAQKAIKLLGGILDRAEMPKPKEYPTEHTMIYIRKIAHTAPYYPRKAGTPGKTPIK
jgi:16S rRNA (guanine527-N7)-methyltransferase